MNFIRFLHTGYDRKIEEVVLLGDIFDNWVFPYDLVPPTMEELLSAEKNKNVIRELRSLAKKTKVYYVPGNHDMHATAAVMEDFFSDSITYCPNRYCSDRLIAEHGHRYAMFNAPARFSTNIMGLPLGYFISRIEATKKAMTNSEGRSYHTYVDDFIEMFGEQTLPQSVKVCIFGHSHKSEIDQDTWFVNDRIYANTGYWCGEKCTFIEAEKTDNGYDVGIVKWVGNDRIERKERESI